MDISTESGARRVFVGAIEWPGWCRSARSEEDALRSLIEYGPRYAAAVTVARPKFRAPGSVSDLHVVERLGGNSTTDFGAPSVAPAADLRDVGPADLSRLQAILESCWVALDRAVGAAEGRTLATGPRGGGRDLHAIATHVDAAEASYLTRLGARGAGAVASDARSVAGETRAAFLEALARAVENGLPERGPRGGKIWRPRYLVRRTAWHALDHAWEIEDRAGIARESRRR